MEEEVLDRTVRRTSSGKGCVPVARYWMNNACTYPTSDVVSVRIMYFTNLFSQYKRYIIICPYMSSTRHNHFQGLFTVADDKVESFSLSYTHDTKLLGSIVDCIRGFKSASPQWLLDAGGINHKVRGLQSMKYVRGFSSPFLQKRPGRRFGDEVTLFPVAR
jgi:hypothetical protein